MCGFHTLSATLAPLSAIRKVRRPHQKPGIINPNMVSFLDILPASLAWTGRGISTISTETSPWTLHPQSSEVARNTTRVPVVTPCLGLPHVPRDPKLLPDPLISHPPIQIPPKHQASPRFPLRSGYIQQHCVGRYQESRWSSEDWSATTREVPLSCAGGNV